MNLTHFGNAFAMHVAFLQCCIVMQREETVAVGAKLQNNRQPAALPIDTSKPADLLRVLSRRPLGGQSLWRAIAGA